MKLTAILTIILAAALSVSAQSNGTMSGKVILRGQAQSNVNVDLESTSDSGLQFNTRTNAAGEYSITNIPPGNYAVKVSSNDSAGMSRQQVQDWRGEIRFVRGEKKQLDIDLDKPMAYREEVVVIASGTEQPISGVSKTIDVINAQELRDRADFSLAETLRTVPGFRVQQLGGFGRTATIKTRGLRNQDTAILLDGIRFRDASAITGDASPFLSDLTLTSVSRIEVLRGSGSSLYGTNAIGGTVDLQSPVPASGTHGQLSFAAGGLGLTRFRGNLSHGVASGKFGIGAGISRTVYTKGVDGQDDASNTNFQTRAEFKPFSRTSISVRSFLSDAKVRLNSGPDTLGTLPLSTNTIIDAVPNVTFVPDVNDPDSFQHSKFQNVQVAVNHAVNSVFVLGGYYQGLHSTRRNDDGPLGVGFQSAFTSEFEGTIQTANFHGAWMPVRQNSLTAGYEFEHERFGNNGSTPNGTGDFSVASRQSSHTFYVQDLVELFEQRLQISGAFRIQSFSLETPTCGSGSCPAILGTFTRPPSARTGDASVAYSFRSTGTKIRSHIGNGYREPSLYERFGSYFFLNAFFPLGNPALKPERSTAIDAGIEQTFARGRVKLSGTYFYTVIRDEITYLPTDDFAAPAYYNFDKHLSRGMEYSATMKASESTDLFASYTFTNSDIRNFRRPTFPVGPVSSTDRSAFGIPDHQFTLVATQRFRRAWVNFDFLGTSSYLAPIFSNTSFSTYVYRFAGNRKGDLTAGYTFSLAHEKTTLRIYGTIENIFNQEYFENGFRSARRTARAGLTFGF